MFFSSVVRRFTYSFNTYLGLKFTSSSKMVDLKLQFPGDSFRDPLSPPIWRSLYIAIVKRHWLNAFSTFPIKVTNSQNCEVHVLS